MATPALLTAGSLAAADELRRLSGEPALQPHPPRRRLRRKRVLAREGLQVALRLAQLLGLERIELLEADQRNAVQLQ